MNDDTYPEAINSLTESFPGKVSLRQAFESLADTKILIAKDIEGRIERTLSALVTRPTIKVRTKKFVSFYKKLQSLRKLSGNPNPQITDLIGIRVICPFTEDLSIAENLLKKKFDVVEVERKRHSAYYEFGYESTHLLIKIPADIFQARGDIGCDVIEVQLRTILQDAWAEVEHELIYKAGFTPYDTPMKRKLSALNASLSLADIIFQEIRYHQRRLHGQLGKRQKTFYKKIEDATDALLFSELPGPESEQPKGESEDILLHPPDENSIDDLLLSALTAHNENRFEDAVRLYGGILVLNPDKTVRSLIYNHRGMAHFAQSKYQDAITDFTSALDLDEKSYKAAYYRGVVHSVLRQYAGAIDDYTLSLKINPSQAFCLFRRGQAYYHLGDYPQALSDCEASLSVKSDNDAAVKFRDLLQAKLKM
jgi:putative GTP pyrophosphokinase